MSNLTDPALLGFYTMTESDFGGTITHNRVTVPAVIGAFDEQQVLNADGGGFSPMLMGQATVARQDLPETFAGFKRGHTINVTPGDGTRPSRVCAVYNSKECGALIELTLHDKNQGA